MMSGVSNYGANAWLNAVLNHTPFSVSQIYVQLHIGDPGPNCTNNPALNSTRVALTAASANGTTWTQVNDLEWPLVGFKEVYTHASLWDAPTFGNALWSGALTKIVGVNASDSFTLPTSSLTVSVA